MKPITINIDEEKIIINPSDVRTKLVKPINETSQHLTLPKPFRNKPAQIYTEPDHYSLILINLKPANLTREEKKKINQYLKKQGVKI